MGTSQSSAGPGGRSPLVPPWADDQPRQPLPSPEPARFRPFRQSLGSFISSGDRGRLDRALWHYASKASGGSDAAVRRMGSVVKAGGRLFGTLGGLPAAQEEATIDLGSLSGLPCELAISKITQTLATGDGDADKIRFAMNHALVEALDGVETFDPQAITDDVIVDTMIAYLSESIFLQIVMDAGKAWNKAETPVEAIRAESALREMIKVIVDRNMGSRLKGSSIRSFDRTQMVQVERQTITDVWNEWEAYQ